MGILVFPVRVVSSTLTQFKQVSSKFKQVSIMGYSLLSRLYSGCVVFILQILYYCDLYSDISETTKCGWRGENWCTGVEKESSAPEVSSLISCDAVLVRKLCGLWAKFGQILNKNCSMIEVPRGTGILLRFKTASQLINELVSVEVLQFTFFLDPNPDQEWPNGWKSWLRIRIQGWNHNTSNFQPISALITAKSP